MKCPYCSCQEDKVIDSRPADDGLKIRRKRECLACQKRFTTFEIIETTPLMVIKKDGSREPFNKEKLLKGLMRACEKRPVPFDILSKASNDIEGELLSHFDQEIPNEKIGELAMEKLKQIDDVAYVRFASVYRQFKDINSFVEEIKTILQKRET